MLSWFPCPLASSAPFAVQSAKFGKQFRRTVNLIDVDEPANQLAQKSTRVFKAALIVEPLEID